MKRVVFLASADAGLLAHWSRLQPGHTVRRLQRANEIGRTPRGSIVVVDLGLPQLPSWRDPQWKDWTTHALVVAASASPVDEEGLAALNAGAVGYCHAYAGANVMRQVVEVVGSGELWVGRALMQRLLTAVHTRIPNGQHAWAACLTEREIEVARAAANGAANAAIAQELGITERTVKAHLSAVFDKLQVADRVQLALKVHGLR